MAVDNSMAIKRLEALFQGAKLEKREPQEVLVEVETKHSLKCDVHKNARRGSLGSTLHLTNRLVFCLLSFNCLCWLVLCFRRDSLGNVVSQKRDWHPSGYFGGVGPRRESMPALSNQTAYASGGFYRLVTPNFFCVRKHYFCCHTKWTNQGVSNYPISVGTRSSCA